MSDVAGLLCLRTDEHDRSRPLAPGTQEVPCHECGTALLIAPSGRAAAARLGLLLVCSHCIPADAEVVAPTRASAAELGAMGIDVTAITPQVVEAVRTHLLRRRR